MIRRDPAKSTDSNEPADSKESRTPFVLGNRRRGEATPSGDAGNAPTGVAMSSTSNAEELGSGDADDGVVGVPPESDGEATATLSSAPELETKPDRAGGIRGVGGLLWLLLAASVAAVVMAYVSWHHADHDPDRHRAALRDEALIEGTADVETMTSMDHRDVAGGLKAWRSVSTGVLHDQLVAIDSDQQKMLADQGKIATGHVVQAALTDLTDRTATLIVAVEVAVRGDDQSKEPTVKRNRFSADLSLVNGQWKIENLQQVAVNVS